MENIIRQENNEILLVDSDEYYLTVMSEFIAKRPNAPWRVRTVNTGAKGWEDIFLSGIGKKFVAVSESSYETVKDKLEGGLTVILNETGKLVIKEYENIDKFMAAEEVYKALVNSYTVMICGDTHKSCLNEGVLIGVFSPDNLNTRDLFARMVARRLSKDYRTLFITTEVFGGIESNEEWGLKDLGDLMFFVNDEDDKFNLWLETIVCKEQGLYYIPPLKAGFNVPFYTEKEWLRLIELIKNAGYERIVFDLSIGVCGLMEILKKCNKILTVTARGKNSEARYMQFAELVSFDEAKDVLGHSIRCFLPERMALCRKEEMWITGEFADIICDAADRLEVETK
ncbi:MAG: hypothetical protein K6F84_02010 [Lachnospiraceae bacterium]|nr:hypothetical protein [Lachnospiraceae bacterium]